VNVTIVEAGSDQLGIAQSLLERFFREEGFGTPPEVLRSNLDAFAADPTCGVLLAWTDGVAVGAATVSTTRSTEDGQIAEIQDLYVLPEHRGSGVARLLVEEATAWALEQGCRSVEVVVTPEAEAAHRLSAFYARLGFDATGRTIHARRLSRS
jgi:GNAT superfamily N-acetyltransferase